MITATEAQIITALYKNNTVDVIEDIDSSIREMASQGFSSISYKITKEVENIPYFAEYFRGKGFVVTSDGVASLRIRWDICRAEEK